MGSVYSHAVYTIASTGAATTTASCFHARNPSTLLPCVIGVSSPDAPSPTYIYARRDDAAAFTRGVDLAPLNTRGWVLQERLLSRRVLHFGEELLYWECGGRAASELNPHGYTYKRAVEDCRDNYAPDLTGTMSTRAEMRQAELEGRGISWAGDESIRRRPPHVVADPDAPRAGGEVWQHKRGFWRNVLKEDEKEWGEDEKCDGVGKERDRAGFRAAFERLRGGGTLGGEKGVVGRRSFSQLWYDVVESYSRTRLTVAGDKLMALKGIEDEVARATKFTYLKGVWKEMLVTDLLWFAIEGPGKRLVDAKGVPVAPTWSWASIEGAVALDLLLENSMDEIEVTGKLAVIKDVSPADDDPSRMKIWLKAPILSVKLLRDGDAGMWYINIGKTSKPSARVFLDVELPGLSEMADLVCVSFLVLNRDKTWARIKSSREDVQGLVLRKARVKGEDENVEDVYERIGYFTTSYIVKLKAAKAGRKALKKAEERSVCLTGWSGSLMSLGT